MLVKSCWFKLALKVASELESSTASLTSDSCAGASGACPGRALALLISAMCVCALGVRALLISVLCCFGTFCGRGRSQDLVERVGFEISCRNQGSLLRGSGLRPFWGGGPPRGSFLCHTKNGHCVPQRSLKSRQFGNNNKIDPALEFRTICGPPGPRAGPWSPGNASGS